MSRTEMDREEMNVKEEVVEMVEQEIQDFQEKPKSLAYGIEDSPPWYIAIALALQVILSIISGPIGVAYMIYPLVCADDNNLVLSQLINTSVFMAGISTFLQVTFGMRLPIVQGSSFIYLLPIMTMLQSEQWKCPEKFPVNDTGLIGNSSDTYGPLENLEKPWMPRLAAISGSFAVASILHMLLGATGFIWFLMRFVGPLTFAPTIGIIGIMFYDAINMNARYQWGLCFGTVALIIIFSLFMKNVTVPLFSFGKVKAQRIPVFKLFSVFFAIIVMWILCIILTAAGAFPSDPDHLAYKARADARLDVLSLSAWVFVPYPGQWGPITIDAVTALSTVGCVIASCLESVSDYHATARVCEVAAPPKHAINRGILTEGVCSLISSLVGAAHATTSYSNVMGLIGYTGNASRISFQIASAILVLFGIFGKFGAALATMPQPILGGSMMVGLGMCFSIGISNLKQIDMESPRNQMVLAISFVLGVTMPMCYKDYPESLKTGVYFIDEVIKVLCTNAPLLAGLTGFLLDNIIPGTRKERGMADLEKVSPTDAKIQVIVEMDYAPYHSRLFTYLSKFSIVRFIPFLPDKNDMAKETKHKVVCINN